MICGLRIGEKAQGLLMRVEEILVGCLQQAMKSPLRFAYLARRKRCRVYGIYSLKKWDWTPSDKTGRRFSTTNQIVSRSTPKY